MRFLMYVSLPVEKFNQAARDGTADKKIAKILEDIKPEAAYFFAKDGKRTALLVVNMDDASEIPSLAEPWFLTFDASVQFQPCMLPEDLKNSGLEKIAKKWK